MRRRTITAFALVGAFALAGCANGGYTSTGGQINVVTVDLPDGRAVVCVNVSNSVDCDWEGAGR